MSFFKEYISMWKNGLDFSSRTSRRGYWMAMLQSFIAIILITVCFAVVVSCNENGILAAIFGFLFIIYMFMLIIPGFAICIRRMRDAGKAWYWLFINIIPICGPIWFVILLCKKSVPDDGTPVV